METKSISSPVDHLSTSEASQMNDGSAPHPTDAVAASTNDGNSININNRTQVPNNNFNTMKKNFMNVANMAVTEDYVTRAARLAKGQPVSLLAVALDFARRGFSVVPLKPGSKKPALRRCYEIATANQEKIRNWWKREPSLNIGVMPAASGLCVIDVDGKLGEDSLSQLEALFGKLPPLTVQVNTPNGGRHLYFRCNKSFPSCNGVAAGIDIRSNAGHCVVPPSQLLEGDYEFEPGLSFDDLAPAILPDTWVKFFSLPRGGGSRY